MKKKIWWILLAVLIVMQLIPYHIKNKDFDATKDFIAIEKPNDKIAQLLRASCYDCHSHEAKTPWYGYVAPVKFWINKHVRGGRMNLDLSHWGELSADERSHKLNEMAEEIESHEMPLNSYLWLHDEAKLTDEEINLMSSYLKSL